jgi:hypothetical protein
MSGKFPCFSKEDRGYCWPALMAAALAFSPQATAVHQAKFGHKADITTRPSAAAPALQRDFTITLVHAENRALALLHLERRCLARRNMRAKGKALFSPHDSVLSHSGSAPAQP